MFQPESKSPLDACDSWRHDKLVPRRSKRWQSGSTPICRLFDTSHASFRHGTYVISLWSVACGPFRLIDHLIAKECSNPINLFLLFWLSAFFILFFFLRSVIDISIGSQIIDLCVVKIWLKTFCATMRAFIPSADQKESVVKLAEIFFSDQSYYMVISLLNRAT